MKFVDPDGKDYGLNFDDETMTATVCATYYATSSSLASAKESAESLNNQSGNFSYSVGEGDAAKTYSVNIDVKVEEVQVDPKIGELGSLNVALGSDNSGLGNVYRVVPDSDMGENTNGTTTGGNYIQVKESKQHSKTGGHEMGHTVGLDHNSSGLMTAGETDPNRSSKINKSDIKDMFSYQLKGKNNYGYDVKGNRVYTGRGTVINNTNHTIDQLKKGKVK